MVKSPSSEWYSPDTRIILLTPPPVNTHQWVPAMVEFTGLPAEACLQNRTPARVKTYAEAVVQVGKEAGVPTVNLFDVLWNAAGGVEKDLDKYMSDGLHLSTEGYKVRVLVSTLCRMVSEELFHSLCTLLSCIASPRTILSFITTNLRWDTRSELLLFSLGENMG